LSEGSVLSFKILSGIFRLHSGIFRLLKSCFQDFDILKEIFTDDSFVVKIEASGLKSFDLDIFILTFDFLTSQLSDNVHTWVSEYTSGKLDGRLIKVAVVKDALVSLLGWRVSGGWSPSFGW